MRSNALAAALAFASASAAFAGGETITVTTLEDTVDFGMPRQVVDLPGPDGQVSFREAVFAANNTAGPQTITFAIPTSEWWLYDDRAILRLEDGPFVLSDDETTVDFSTQTDFTGDTNPDGSEVGIYGLQPNGWGGPAISVYANDCVIKGLGRVMQRGHAVLLHGHRNRVIGCTISGPFYSGVYVNGEFNGPAARDNVVGGTAPGEGNRLSAGNSGVRVDGPAEDTIVIGNVLSGSFAGVEVRSPYCCPGNDAARTRIGGPTPEERNVIANAGHYGEEGFPVGAQVDLQYAVDTLIEGNLIGLEPDGTTGAGQIGPTGINVRSSTGTVIRDNAIGDIAVTGVNHHAGVRFGTAINVIAESTGTQIVDNRIGVGVDGTTPVPNYRGIAVTPFPALDVPSDTTVGGTDAGNVIAFSESIGVLVSSLVDDVTISENSIHSNDGLGIDLFSNSGGGVTPNDDGDADSGGNGLQNFPILAAASSAGGTVTVSGTLPSTPSSTFTVELFANPACDSSGHGEGRVFLGSTTVTTDAGGEAMFEVMLAADVEPGHVVTATATRQDTGATSEFSPCVEVEPGETASADANGDGRVDVDDLIMVITSWGECDGCPADLDGNGVVDVDDLLMVILQWT